MFQDAGSAIEQADGSRVTYPGFGAKQVAFSRGVFFNMYDVVCNGRGGARTSDPKAWTQANFKVGR